MAKTRTAKQRAALRKAQLASARKRRGKRKGKSTLKRGRALMKTRLKAGAKAALGIGAVGGALYLSTAKGRRKFNSAAYKAAAMYWGTGF